MLLTRSLLFVARRQQTVQLACIRHAASVHPEPGSNSLVFYSLLFFLEDSFFPFFVLSCAS